MQTLIVALTLGAESILGLLYWATAPEFWARFDAVARHGE